MTSNRTKEPAEAYVWIFLPEEVTPVVAGRVFRSGQHLLFNYGKSYLERAEANAGAMPIHLPELPLVAGAQQPLEGLTMAGCLRDAAPDAWGRRVIIHQLMGGGTDEFDTDMFSEMTYLLESGSDRIGALDFQRSPTEYVPRYVENPSLEELLSSAERVEQGLPLNPDLDRALFHGSAIGGARPKALVEDGEKKYVAKFSSSTDYYSVVKAEFIAMRLAQLAGINVAPVRIERVAHRDVLLVERFDRRRTANGWARRAMVSALTLFEMDEMMARYASYENLAAIIRARFTDPAATLREMFKRLTFNILTGNTDDHARNHAALRDGDKLTLSPAYDICPQQRTGGEATQAMLIYGHNNFSQIKVCIQARDAFLISKVEAEEIVEHQIGIIKAHWQDVCDEAGLSEVEKRLFWGRQFLNEFALQ